MKKAKGILFGASESGKRLYWKLQETYDIIGFWDNDKMRDNGQLFDLPVTLPNKDTVFDYVIITSIPGLRSIYEQLIELGIPHEKIITKYVENPIIARETFLKSLATIICGKKYEGSLAEAGVFQGDFAKVINAQFPDRKLYLFDTFEGFDSRDIETEKKVGYSNATQGNYNITSEQIVMNKMKYPDKVVIKKGYFPQTTEGIEDKFIFVNLDLDLYMPTLAGLEWFIDGNRMHPKGVVLVHDYFSPNFYGVKEAVDLFLKDKSYYMLPIGDELSVAISGF